jgi:3-hydroxyacyl-CoA dehydrogenase
VFDELCARKRLGQKSGAGWYRYEGRVAQPDVQVAAVIEQASAAAGLRRRQIRPEEIVGRTVAALIDEAARILEEGHAARASDIDVVWVHGYGFPPFRGGPLQYADSIGLKTVYQDLCAWRAAAGDSTPVSDLLARLATSGASFANYDDQRPTD